ncbi:MAG: hypothetical protein JW987_01260 [Anaerolineaceae bacterium]|nr:hypothetical protein [Anaerolineaceae bacterium]
MPHSSPIPGWIALLGSGETAAAGGQWFEQIAAALPAPVNIAVMETPAGFELNARRVAERVSEFLKIRLQNYRPRIETLSLRHRGGPFSTDDPALCQPLLDSNLIYLGAGSPTYTARQLSGSLAWDLVQARHRLGATVGLASAAAIAAGTHALPVYEIFKAGMDLHWRTGLDLLGAFGLSLVIVSHWNNNDGGAELDTSRCFVGQERFRQLTSTLPADSVILGLDEHTGLILDLAAAECRVVGRDTIHILRAGQDMTFHNGETFPIHLLGDYHPLEDPSMGLPAAVWQQAADFSPAPNAQPELSAQVQELLARRQAAREAQQWAEADRLRAEIATLGWQVKDTAAGPQLEPMGE